MRGRFVIALAVLLAGSALVATLADSLMFLVESREMAAIDADPPEVLPPSSVGMTASWYGAAYHGRKTASGARFDRYGLTAAHRTLPFGTRLRCEYRGHAVIVTVTDRGPLAWTGKDLDLSEAAFASLAPLEVGVLRVQVRRVEP